MSTRPHPSRDYDPGELDPAATLRERIRLESARLEYLPWWQARSAPDGSWGAEVRIGLVTERFAGFDEVDVLQAVLDAMRRARGSR
jgi:hypothetical protein